MGAQFVPNGGAVRPRGGNSSSQRWEQLLPTVGTVRPNGWNSAVPNGGAVGDHVNRPPTLPAAPDEHQNALGKKLIQPPMHRGCSYAHLPGDLTDADPNLARREVAPVERPEGHPKPLGSDPAERPAFPQSPPAATHLALRVGLVPGLFLPACHQNLLQSWAFGAWAANSGISAAAAASSNRWYFP